MAEAAAVESLLDEMIDLLDQVNAANELNQDAISANAAYQGALAGISDEVQRQKDAYQQEHDSLDGCTLSLDAGTEAGSANAASLSDVASAAQNAVEKQFELDSQTMSAKDAAEKYAATLGAQMQSFIDSAITAGYNADEVKALADRVFQLPTEKEIAILADTAQAQIAIDSYISKNDGREVILKIGTSRVGQGLGGSGGITQADGGIVTYHANGSVSENHVAQIARAREWRVWAEDETGSEAYIPLALSKRARSNQVMAETAWRLGDTFTPDSASSTAGASLPVAVAYAAAGGAPTIRVVVTSKGESIC